MTQVNGDWLTDPRTQRVMEMLDSVGHKVFFVGGCVRNALIGAPVADIDISTDALPERVVQLARDAGLKPVPTGIDHGTITVVSSGLPHEITTFRDDVETDGRRAVVAFSDNIADDAARRDFTMNALYADRTGKIFDPLDGLPDLQARRVVFIEDADRRIKEDYLRSLRFFRFHAWYGDPSAGLDVEALAAIAENLDGLDGLSRERVGAEVKKLLSAPDPAPAVAAMESCGVLGRLLSGATSKNLAHLVAIDAGIPADPIRRLAIVGGADAAVRLRLSKQEIAALQRLIQRIGDGTGLGEIAYREGGDVALNTALLRAATFEQPPERNFKAKIANGSGQSFPVSASDLMPELEGVALGERLRELEDRWIHSDFRLTRSQLLT